VTVSAVLPPPAGRTSGLARISQREQGGRGGGGGAQAPPHRALIVGSAGSRPSDLRAHVGEEEAETRLRERRRRWVRLTRRERKRRRAVGDEEAMGPTRVME
jgi:hypothetical protein